MCTGLSPGNVRIIAGTPASGDQHALLFFRRKTRGGIEASGVALATGDALRITDATTLHLKNGRDSEVLVFDLPKT